VLDASAVPLIKLDPHAAEVVVHRLSSVPKQVGNKRSDLFKLIWLYQLKSTRATKLLESILKN